jgi:hypothetical protein
MGCDGAWRFMLCRIAKERAIKPNLGETVGGAWIVVVDAWRFTQATPSGANEAKISRRPNAL